MGCEGMMGDEEMHSRETVYTFSESVFLTFIMATNLFSILREKKKITLKVLVISMIILDTLLQHMV